MAPQDTRQGTANRILVSACRLGHAVRYDGGATTLDDPRLDAWRAAGRLVPFCPEVAAGAPAPRPPTEIAGPGGGEAVLAGTARILQGDGCDLTALHLAGARLAVEIALREGCGFALLQDRSPTCGVTTIYDGSHMGRRIPGEGVAAAALRRAGILVFTDLDALIEAVEPTDAPASVDPVG